MAARLIDSSLLDWRTKEKKLIARSLTRLSPFSIFWTGLLVLLPFYFEKEIEMAQRCQSQTLKKSQVGFKLQSSIVRGVIFFIAILLSKGVAKADMN